MSSKVPQVPQPESLKKANLASLDFKAFKAAVLAKRKLRHQFLTTEAIKRTAAYARKHREERKAQKQLKLEAKKNGDYFLEAEPRVAFVVRIYGIRKIPPKQRKTLQLLRLRRIFSGVFVKLNPAMIKLLASVEPYITWGYPSLDLVRTLIYKRGYLRPRHQKSRVRLQSNEQIFERFDKDTNIICAEDLVNEIYTGGRNFKVASNALWPFKLRPPTGGMRKKRIHFVLGGDCGNREHFINKFVGRMV